jgi:hypothetical protein
MNKYETEAIVLRVAAFARDVVKATLQAWKGGYAGVSK